MRRPSVRGQVTVVASLAVGLVLAVAGLMIVATVEGQLVGDVDDTATTIAREIGAELARGPAPGLLVVRGDEDAFAQLVDPGGRVVAATANVTGQPAVVTTSGISTRKGVPLDPARFRVLARPVEGGLLVVGLTLDDIDESVDALRRTLLVISPIVLALLALLVWYVVGRTLRPVEEAHRRQRKFVADASHELRSPLTRIRTELEVDLAHQDQADPWATHRTVLADTVTLQALVDDLLLLARRDADPSPARRAPVDLDDLVLDEAQPRTRDGITIDVSGVSGGQVLGDVDQLRRVVRNLLDNAVRHARATVTIELDEDGDATVLAIADDGPGIPPDDRERVFERFTRLDDARTRANGGTGLGLAITRDIVEAHGGTVSVDPRHGQGTRMVTRLPRPS